MVQICPCLDSSVLGMRSWVGLPGCLYRFSSEVSLLEAKVNMTIGLHKS